MDITIFVPCYNEEKNIVNTLKTIQRAFTQIKLSYEIIVIDDGSKDNSSSLAQQFKNENPEVNLQIYKQSKNKGLSYNFAEAAFYGTGLYYRQVNGDNDETVETLIKVFSNIGKADLIIPYHASATARSPSRRIISSSYTRLINFLNGQKINYYNGLAIYKRSQVMRWHSRSHGYGYQAELITNLLNSGATYMQVPVVASNRMQGESKAFSLKNLFSISHTILKLILIRLSNSYNGTSNTIAMKSVR